MNTSSGVVFVRDTDLTNELIDDDGLTAAASCKVVGLRERRRIVTIPPTLVTTLRRRPLKNSMLRDGGRRNPVPKAPVSLETFQDTGSQNLIILSFVIMQIDCIQILI